MSDIECVSVWTDPSSDLRRFRGLREGKEGVGRDESDVFFRGRGDSGRKVRDFRIPLFLFCFLDIEGWPRELRKGKDGWVSSSG
jgi:hypothetical protein